MQIPKKNSSINHKPRASQKSSFILVLSTHHRPPPAAPAAAPWPEIPRQAATPWCAGSVDAAGEEHRLRPLLAGTRGRKRQAQAARP